MIIIYIFLIYVFNYVQSLCRFARSEEHVHQYSRSQRQSKEPPPLSFCIFWGLNLSRIHLDNNQNNQTFL